MKLIKFFIICSAFVIIPFNMVFATPNQVVIIRHADKLVQDQPGPALTAKGQIRAVKFAFYYLEKFGKPDFLYAADPEETRSKSYSVRSIQTLAPLANMLEEEYPEEEINISHPYNSDDYSKLAKLLLNEKEFHGKSVLIAWSHEKIPGLAQKLGVWESLPEWTNDNYDSVYVINYDVSSGKVTRFTILNNQYPITFTGSWKELYELLQNNIRK